MHKYIFLSTLSFFEWSTYTLFSALFCILFPGWLAKLNTHHSRFKVVSDFTWPVKLGQPLGTERWLSCDGSSLILFFLSQIFWKFFLQNC